MNKLYAVARKFLLLYRIPPGYWFLIMLVFLLLWTVLMLTLYHRDWLRRGLNLALMLVGLCVVLLVTFIRRGSSAHQVVLIPLRVLFGLRAPRDYWHVTVMNIVLYVPFACGLCFCMEWSHGWLRRHPELATILLCLLMSVSAEALQYFLGSGLAEVDDVLMNTLSGTIGTLPYVITTRILQ